VKYVRLLMTLFVASCLISTARAQYGVLWSFAGAPTDGDTPLGNLISDGKGHLFGTTRFGGHVQNSACRRGCGTVFVLSQAQGGEWNESLLYSFCGNYNANSGQCLDGEFPEAGLVFDKNGNIYGTTYGGGPGCPLASYGCGIVFELSPPLLPAGRWTESVLYNFCGNYANNICLDGNFPVSQLVFDPFGNLYGTTIAGGAGHMPAGTAFKLSQAGNGWAETVIYNFCSLGKGDVCPDGSQPMAGVTLDKAGNLYGTAQSGGAPNSTGGGVLYKLSPSSNGWTQTILLAAQFPYKLGSSPVAGVTLGPSGAIFTTFESGGPTGVGGVVRLLPTGTHTEFWFNGKNGQAPTASVLVDFSHNALYGTTSGSGFTGGNVFKLTGLDQQAVLYSFCSQQNCTDGLDPVAGLITDKSGNLYGTTASGGANSSSCGGSGCGVVFEIATETRQTESRLKFQMAGKKGR